MWHDVKDIYFYRNVTQTPYTKHMTSEEVLEIIQPTKQNIHLEEDKDNWNWWKKAWNI